MTNDRKSCVFCGSSDKKITREHLFKREYRDRLPHIDDVVMTHNHGGAITSNPIGRTEFDITMKVACSTCNAGWLNDLEYEAEPTLFSPKDLKVGNLERTAAWAAGRALVRSCGEPGPNRPPEQIFHDFYTTRDVPEGVRVMIGRTNEAPLPGGRYSYSTSSTHADRTFGAIVTWTINGLVFLVAIAAPDAREHMDLILDDVRTRCDGRLAFISPLEGDVEQLLTAALTAVDLRAAGDLGSYLRR